LKDQIRSALSGDNAAIARLLSLAETAGELAFEIQESIFPHTGKAHLLGITGPAGAGKSTLISKLAAIQASGQQRIAIVACDPSSPGSGGALLGDRIRMHELVSNQQIFIRSIASRDSSDGLPLAAFRAADIFDACGFDTVIIETVGTGQNQIDIMQAAHTVIAVSAPGLGDGIQAMKSGLMDVADIHAVTKSDLEGSAKTVLDIQNAVHMRQTNTGQERHWSADVLPVSGLTGDGISELHQAIMDHLSFLKHGENMQQRCHRMMTARIHREAVDALTRSLTSTLDGGETDAIQQLIQRKTTPGRVTDEILASYKEET